jgi:hypothetical protein
MPWVSTVNVTSLNYSLDGGTTWINCSGTVSGESGTATGPVFVPGQAFSLIIKDTLGNVSNTVTGTVLSGANGTVLATESGENVANLGGTYPITNVASFYFKWMATNIGDASGGFGFIVQGTDGSGGNFEFTSNLNWGTNSSPGSMDPCVGIAPQGGSVALPVTNNGQLSGTVTMEPVGESMQLTVSVTALITGVDTELVYLDGVYYVDTSFKFTQVVLNNGVVFPGNTQNVTYLMEILEFDPTAGGGNGGGGGEPIHIPVWNGVHR